MQQTYPREELLLAYLNLLIHNTLVKQRFHEFKTFLRGFHRHLHVTRFSLEWHLAQSEHEARHENVDSCVTLASSIPKGLAPYQPTLPGARWSE